MFASYKRTKKISDLKRAFMVEYSVNAVDISNMEIISPKFKI